MLSTGVLEPFNELKDSRISLCEALESWDDLEQFTLTSITIAKYALGEIIGGSVQHPITDLLLEQQATLNQIRRRSGILFKSKLDPHWSFGSSSSCLQARASRQTHHFDSMFSPMRAHEFETLS